ncbi:hypothetical protein WS86_13485 [Burkholderia savannae]|nr:hypothetical protein WS86_13485 [Burkholderia savannae]
MIQNLLAHIEETREEALRSAVGVDELIVVALGFLKQAFARLEPIEINPQPAPFFAPTAGFDIKWEAGDACLVAV